VHHYTELYFIIFQLIQETKEAETPTTKIVVRQCSFAVAYLKYALFRADAAMVTAATMVTAVAVVTAAAIVTAEIVTVGVVTVEVLTVEVLTVGIVTVGIVTVGIVTAGIVTAEIVTAVLAIANVISTAVNPELLEETVSSKQGLMKKADHILH